MLLLLVLQKQLLLGNVVSVTAAKVPTSKFSLSSNSKKCHAAKSQFYPSRNFESMQTFTYLAVGMPVR